MNKNLTIDALSQTAELKLEGELSIQHATELRSVLTEALDEADTCILDLEGVQVFDLSAIQLLYAFHLAAKSYNKQLTLKDECPEKFRKAVENAGYSWQHWFGFGEG
ncbi:MAG: STAS domain-containing protein [SAR324 cluster bacterium]|nr:STAS domain-containing protein [SAR324 cluster bacterium]